jgi:four helix bundle protein
MLTHKTLIAWQRARQLVLLVGRAQRTHWQPWTRSFWDQLQRASLSAQLNLAEGYSLLSERRWAYFAGIAHASAIEALEVIELLRDLEAIPEDLAATLTDAATQSVRLTLGLLKRARARAH